MLPFMETRTVFSRIAVLDREIIFFVLAEHFPGKGV